MLARLLLAVNERAATVATLVCCWSNKMMMKGDITVKTRETREHACLLYSMLYVRRARERRKARATRNSLSKIRNERKTLNDDVTPGNPVRGDDDNRKLHYFATMKT